MIELGWIGPGVYRKGIEWEITFPGSRSTERFWMVRL